ncbi:MAG: hypothetical protein NZO16_03760 [Deltaproteobacteria bacterium]|nr:hypothetical protein [Deltaproteobacteria bacterium]
MALLDIRHTVTPLKNKFNLILIVVIAILFAIYRTSTSKSQASSSPAPSSIIDEEILKKLEKLGK